MLCYKLPLLKAGIILYLINSSAAEWASPYMYSLKIVVSNYICLYVCIYYICLQGKGHSLWRFLIVNVIVIQG